VHGERFLTEKGKALKRKSAAKRPVKAIF